MFKENKYTKTYFIIIKNAKCRFIDGYLEKHHIIPKCLGGTDTEDNLVLLTAKEHFVCHRLLTKMSDENKLKFALVAMTLKNDHQSRHRVNSRSYEYVRKMNSIAASEKMIGHKGHILGRTMYHDINGNHRFFYSDEIVSDGWFKGWNEKVKKKIGNSNYKKVYYYNDLGDVIAINSDETPPSGWKKGNPKADTSKFTNIKGSKYYHDPEGGEEKRCHECPKGWVAGRSYKWYNNGISNLLVNFITENPPDGYKSGKIRKII